MQIEQLHVLGGNFALLIVEDCDCAAEVRAEDSRDCAQIAMPEIVGVLRRNLIRFRQRRRNRLVVRRGRIGEHEDTLRRRGRAGEIEVRFAVGGLEFPDRRLVGARRSLVAPWRVHLDAERGAAVLRARKPELERAPVLQRRIDMIEGRFLKPARFHVVRDIAAEVVRHVRAVITLVETLEILVVERVLIALRHVERDAHEAQAIGGESEG
jgi:hypothetical protein